MLDIFSLKRKVALVTGGGSGLGRAMSLALCDAGAEVIVTGRRINKLKSVVEEIKKKGGSAFSVVIDVQDETSIKNCLDKIKSMKMNIDILVNNSGISGSSWAVKQKVEDWDAVINTNLRGTFLMCREVGKSMIKRKNGVIVNVSSVAGMIGIQKLAAYSSSKGGIIQLTKTLSQEWAKFGIRINTLAPGYFLTDINKDYFSTESGKKMIENHIPLNRIGIDNELSGAIVFLASEASSFMTGSTLVIDGGQSSL
ncbi:MAG: 2-deoxy-D-gluconate 3-dehydrogenase [Nitrospinae bacterium]|nr:2-deoxy-D-gluconate 3-dehydrogenase [Nitrospinota bacterium]